MSKIFVHRKSSVFVCVDSSCANCHLTRLWELSLDSPARVVTQLACESCHSTRLWELLLNSPLRVVTRLACESCHPTCLWELLLDSPVWVVTRQNTNKIFIFFLNMPALIGINREKTPIIIQIIIVWILSYIIFSSTKVIYFIHLYQMYNELNKSEAGVEQCQFYPYNKDSGCCCHRQRENWEKSLSNKWMGRRLLIATSLS